MKKTLVLAATTLVATLGLVSCGGGNNNSTATSGGQTTTPESSASGATGTSSASGPAVNVKVWCAQEIVELTKKQLNEGFKAAYPQLNVNFTVEAQGEGDAASNMITDVEAGADVFCFAQDQLARLVSAGALAKPGATVASQVKAANDAISVSSASFGEDLYAYPLTSDNGYFMYYDKSIVSETHIDSLEDIIKDLTTADKKMSYQLTTDGAWYNAGFFFGAGCESTWTTDVDGKFTSYVDTYNTAKGITAAKAMQKILTNDAIFVNSSDGADFGKGSGVVVSGTWAYSTIKDLLGENMGIADLPSVTVDSTTFHLGSFAGCKLVGAKPQTDATKGAITQLVAQYITNTDCSLERFDEKGWGPSNLAAQANEKVLASPQLKALNDQSKYARVQGQYPGGWWNLAASIGSSIQGKTDTLENILATYEAGLPALVDAK